MSSSSGQNPTFFGRLFIFLFHLHSKNSLFVWEFAPCDAMQWIVVGPCDIWNPRVAKKVIEVIIGVLFLW